MNKLDFLRKLDRELSVLDKEERKEILAFYEERFYSGTIYENKTELDVINELEAPEVIAKNVLEEYGVSAKFVKNKEERYTNISAPRLVWLIIFDVLVVSWLIPTLYGVVISIFGSLVSYVGVFSLLIGEVTIMDQMLFGFSTGVYVLLFLFALIILELSLWITKKIIIYHLNVLKFKNREKTVKRLRKISIDEWFKKHKLLNTIKSLSFIGAIVVMAYTGFYLFTGDENVFDVYGNQELLSVVNQEDLSQDIIDGVSWDIITDFDNMAVEIYAVNGDEITVNHTYIEESNYEISLDTNLNVITISNRSEYKLFTFKIEDIFSYLNGGDRVIIEVPENLILGDIDIKTFNGSILLDTLIVTEDIKLNTSNGNVKVENIIGQNDITVTTSNGRIALDNLEMLNYDLHTSNGKIIIDNLNITLQDGGTLYARTSNGSIEMNEVYVDDIDIETSNGDIDFYNIDTDFLPDSYDRDTSNGDINTNVR